MAVCLRATFFCMLLALVATASSAVQVAPAPAVDCSTLVLSMTDCLSFVTEGSKVAKPEGQCCTGLKNVLKTNAECLCETFKNSKQLGINLNVSKAATLPAACHVSAPSITNCGLSIGAAPALSPLAVSPSSVAGAPTTSIGVNTFPPAAAPQGSGASSTEIFVLATVVFTAFFAIF
ncbi:hypothetical protein F511_17941 [Dorcoceras hygrometricum]|uniref:Bifunctional inhibitor/plant lipid transfer protein/seed storage helical domain-containing protein n=1 Tax=Dorcoceras hygrometricum TaxID=472368 RepID=A0A2Z7APH1_9LAMI|nr:hypothetical protein F511_17941 [Dorcoceras hygrometricum]